MLVSACSQSSNENDTRAVPHPPTGAAAPPCPPDGSVRGPTSPPSPRRASAPTPCAAGVHTAAVLKRQWIRCRASRTRCAASTYMTVSNPVSPAPRKMTSSMPGRASADDARGPPQAPKNGRWKNAVWAEDREQRLRLRRSAHTRHHGSRGTGQHGRRARGAVGCGIRPRRRRAASVGASDGACGTVWKPGCSRRRAAHAPAQSPRRPARVLGPAPGPARR